jgi:hypothetical protein
MDSDTIFCAGEEAWPSRMWKATTTMQLLLSGQSKGEIIKLQAIKSS